MDLLHRHDPGFDEERSGFQTAYQHEPDIVVKATSAADLRDAVVYAKDNELPFAVQSSGHGLNAALDGGLLISTRRMDAVSVDAATRTAKVEAGATWEQVVDAAAVHGLAPLSGSSPGVGVVGYTLGGGLGVLSRRYGYAAEHVRDIDVVTRDGEQRRVASVEDVDGGVVTGMEFGLFPVERIYGGGLYFSGELVADVLAAYRKWTTDMPDELTSSVAVMQFPDIPMVPEPLRGRYVASVRIAFIGDAVTGERLVAPLRDVGPRLMDTLAEMPFRESASIYNDPKQPHSYIGTNALLSELDPTVLEIIPDLPGCVVQLNHLGGALADRGYLLRLVSVVDGSDDMRSVHQRVLDAVAPWTAGRAPNFVFGQR
jgi:FAD/FMN-containing dehydrogenase